MRLNFGFGARLHEQVRGVACTAGRGRARIADRAVADIVWQVLSDEQIVGIVDNLVRRPFRVGAGINRLERAQPAIQCPACIVVAVLDLVFAEPYDIIIVELGIGKEDAVRIKPLLRMGHIEPPVGIEFIEAAQAETLIAGIIDILVGNRRVVGRDEVYIRQVCARLKAGTIGLNNRTVFADRSGRPEARRLRRVQHAADIVDIAALIVGIDDAAHGKIIRDGQVHDRLDTVAHVATFGERGRRLHLCLEPAELRLVRDQANRAGLRAGTEQGALRTGKHFDALKVCGIDVEIAPGLRDRLLVKVQRHIGRQAGNACGGQVRRG